MMPERANEGILRVIIAVVALADGVLHFLLDFVLFRGNIFGGGGPGGPRLGANPGRVGPPPGGGRLALPLPLNELFLLNLIGAVILVLVFWFGIRLLGRRIWVVDVVMIAYAATTFAAWWAFGLRNPMGLGYLSKGIEIVLIIALLTHIWSLIRPAGSLAASPGHT